jgi:hypothetical protein
LAVAISTSHDLEKFFFGQDIERGYSSVVEHTTAYRGVSNSNLGAPFNFIYHLDA